MHPSKSQHPLKTFLHPYIFVLKEGRAIKRDYLDYSLMMLFIHSSERIASPETDENELLCDPIVMHTRIESNPL